MNQNKILPLNGQGQGIVAIVLHANLVHMQIEFLVLRNSAFGEILYGQTKDFPKSLSFALVCRQGRRRRVPFEMCNMILSAI